MKSTVRGGAMAEGRESARSCGRCRRGAPAQDACAQGPPREREGGPRARPGEGGTLEPTGPGRGGGVEGLDLWGGADVGGTVAAEAEGTSGAGCLLGTTPAFLVASGREEANPEFRGGPHSSPKRRRGGICNQLACLTRPSLCGSVLGPQPTAAPCTWEPSDLPLCPFH